MLISGTVVVWRYLDGNFTPVPDSLDLFFGRPVVRPRQRVYPLYKWVDLLDRAANVITEEHPYCRKLLTEHPDPAEIFAAREFFGKLETAAQAADNDAAQSIADGRGFFTCRLDLVDSGQ